MKWKVTRLQIGIGSQTTRHHQKAIFTHARGCRHEEKKASIRLHSNGTAKKNLTPEEKEKKTHPLPNIAGKTRKEKNEERPRGGACQVGSSPQSVESPKTFNEQ